MAAAFLDGMLEVAMQSKPSSNTRARNKAEGDFQGWLKEQYCCASEQYGVQVHHCKGKTFKHKKVLIGHWFCIPLSVEAHKEYHDSPRAFCNDYGPQSLLWMFLIKRYVRETGKNCPDEVYDSIMDWNK